MKNYENIFGKLETAEERGELQFAVAHFQLFSREAREAILAYLRKRDAEREVRNEE
jgi:endonuclease/exonuclease/phosphatase family metal-dependent hydrolase